MESEDTLSDSRSMAEHANGIRENNWDLDTESVSESKQSNGNLETAPNCSVVEIEGPVITSGVTKSSSSKKLPVEGTVSALSSNEKLHSHKIGTELVRNRKDVKVVAGAVSHSSNASSELVVPSVGKNKGSSRNGHVTDDGVTAKIAPEVYGVENLGKSSSASFATMALQSQGVKDHNKLKPLKKDFPLKVEEDALSCSFPISGGSKPRGVSTTPTYSFNFRCNERAEKRKGFYTKLEEKNHAKEAERNSMQAKCKETQEAELRLLRKSMTFKANPMPSFYQEPPPPKVELKKVPPTRARSPKLGRHKSSNARVEENNHISSSMGRLSLDETKTTNIGLQSGKDHKKPQRRSLPKLPSEKSKGLKIDSNLTDISSNADATNTIFEVGENGIETAASHIESGLGQLQGSEPNIEDDAPDISGKVVVSMQC